MPQTGQEQIDSIRTRMHDYFSALASISEVNTPPGTNAANGHWRAQTFTNADLDKLEAASSEPLTGDAEKLFSSFNAFQKGIRAAFKNENVEASWDTHFVLFWPAFKDAADSIISVVVDVFNLVRGNAEKQKAAKEKLWSDIEALYKKIDDSGKKLDGTHANGFISVDSQKAAQATINELNLSFPKGTGSEAGNLADVLRVICEKIITLRTDNHKPWLQAEWQLSYQGIFKGAAEGLTA